MSTLTTVGLVIVAAMFAAAPWIINAAPYESTMGLVYKIFFFHMPSAWIFLLAAIVSGVYSAMFLFGRKPASDWKAFAAAELAFVFGALTLLTGPLWARKAWGVWWQWDARLTSSLLLWMIFVAYLLVRRYGGPGSDKLSAAVALFGMANVPFVYVSVNVWRTLHPKTSVVPTLQPGMRGVFWFCVAAFAVLYALLLALRVRLATQQSEVERLYLELDDQSELS
jgi:heme exporter protein C